jgi:diguanylate cyclase (GGDEF)-like protein
LPRKLLIIDDAQVMHALVRTRLRDEDLEFHSAFDGKSGLELAAHVNPDVILLDIEMPDTDGYEVCRRLKTSPETSNVPIIFLSGLTSTEEKIKGLNLGAVDYVTKPFDPAELKARVRASLRTKYLMDLLARKAMIDGLTGLWNRPFFEQRLAAEMARSRRHDDPVACIMADVDHFKAVNDKYGHSVGDEVLRRIAATLTSTVRAEDIVCRFGGEEFAILATNGTAAEVCVLAERVRRHVEEDRITIRGAVIQVTCSFGVADIADAAQTPLVEAADLALYQAKAMGRNQVLKYSPGTAGTGGRGAEKPSSTQAA